MRFDWYSATVKGDFENLSASLARDFEWAQLHDVRPFTRYDAAQEFICGDERVVRLDYNHDTESALITASSDNAPRVVNYLRQHYPSHSVSRVDVCEDFTGQGVFEKLDAMFVGVAENEGLRLDMAGDWHRQRGRTRYIGARTSTSMVRVYEKGWQQFEQARAAGTPLPDDFDITRTRVETQVRPHSKDKRSAATYTCADVASYAAWTRHAHSLLAGFELAAPAKDSRARSPHEKKLHHLAKQYARTLRTELERQGGSFELLGKVLIDEVNDIERNALRAAQIAKPKAA